MNIQTFGSRLSAKIQVQHHWSDDRRSYRDPQHVSMIITQPRNWRESCCLTSRRRRLNDWRHNTVPTTFNRVWPKNHNSSCEWRKLRIRMEAKVSSAYGLVRPESLFCVSCDTELRGLKTDWMRLRTEDRLDGILRTEDRLDDTVSLEERQSLVLLATHCWAEGWAGRQSYKDICC